MKAWAVVAPKAPLEEIELPTPEPRGTEVLLEVTHCGVCHSDLHFWKGEYDMGGGQLLKIADRGVELPRAPGHEIAGRVVAWGPEAQGVELGATYVAYPWLGCGTCEHCLREEDNLCATPSALGVVRHGGFASHVVVPHPRYLVAPGNVDPALAATYACSGITAYGAVRKLLPLDPDKPIVLIGAGGLGLMAIAMLRAMGHRAIVSVDMDSRKLEAATETGATETVLAGEGPLDERVLSVVKEPILGVIDFVNNSDTARAGLAILGKGGRLVVVGVAGGQLTLSLAGMVFRAIAVLGSLTGSVQDLRDVIAMANEGRLPATPISTCPKHEANEALLALKHGDVTGRLVLEA